MSSKTLKENWHQFIEKWKTQALENGFPELQPDSDWPSPCEFEQNGKWHWQPIKIDESLSFSNVEEALNIQLNEDFKQFYCQFYSDNISADHEKGELQFLQAWSKTDFERLQQNLIGHLIMKEKLKQTATLFIAVTDQDDLNIVVNNETSEVCLEYVGKEPHQVLAANLSEFILQTQPVIS